jgi:hypothetical protein
MEMLWAKGSSDQINYHATKGEINVNFLNGKIENESEFVIIFYYIYLLFKKKFYKLPFGFLNRNDDF